MSKTILVIGSGISGLSAALHIAKAGGQVVLIAPEPSERAQSVMAAGGVNAAGIGPDTQDSVTLHRDETLAGGCHIASQSAVEGLCQNAPDVVRELEAMGMVFSRDKQGNLMTRAFGGQSKKRTVFSGTSTGKQIVSALNRQVRYYEVKGQITRRLHTFFVRGAIENGSIYGAFCFDTVENEVLFVAGDAVVMACGGQNILFGKTTGSLLCDGGAASALLQQGVTLKNLEMIQYHPTTIETANKRMLVSEAARGEGGRLFYLKEGQRVYFMEDKFGPRGNLMPRDVVSREIYLTGQQVYLDISFLGANLINERLTEVRELCMDYLKLDVTKEPIPVAPSVHFFMGGIAVDVNHATNISGLYAVGECASIYHGANRLGGNSLLAALYSGRVAADHAMARPSLPAAQTDWEAEAGALFAEIRSHQSDRSTFSPFYLLKEIERVMHQSLGIARCAQQLEEGIAEIDFYIDANPKIIYNTVISKYHTIMMEQYLVLAKAILLSALARRESRGAHYRTDFPETAPAFCAASLAKFQDGQIHIYFEKEAR
ncbi:MAG: FAD-dependent oxidoreductase [Oscillospiraceae bacterium]